MHSLEFGTFSGITIGEHFSPSRLACGSKSAAARHAHSREGTQTVLSRAQFCSALTSGGLFILSAFDNIFSLQQVHENVIPSENWEACVYQCWFVSSVEQHRNITSISRLCYRNIHGPPSPSQLASVTSLTPGEPSFHAKRAVHKPVEGPSTCRAEICLQTHGRDLPDTRGTAPKLDSVSGVTQLTWSWNCALWKLWHKKVFLLS